MPHNAYDWDPAPGSALSSAASPIRVSIESDADPAQIVLTVDYPSGQSEVIFDGTDFATFFSEKSSIQLSGIVPQTGGYTAVRFTLTRSGGWPADPDINFIPLTGSVAGDIGIDEEDAIAYAVALGDGVNLS